MHSIKHNIALLIIILIVYTKHIFVFSFYMVTDKTLDLTINDKLTIKKKIFKKNTLVESIVLWFY